MDWCLSHSEILLTRCSRAYRGEFIVLATDQRLLLINYRATGVTGPPFGPVPESLATIPLGPPVYPAPVVVHEYLFCIRFMSPSVNITYRLDVYAFSRGK